MTRRSIRRKLIARLIVVLAAVAVTTSAGLYVYLRGELIEQYDAALQAEAHAIASVWRANEAAEPQAARIAETFHRLRFGRADGDFLRIVRRDGTTALQVPGGAAPVPRPDAGPPDARRHAYDLRLPDGRLGRAVEVMPDGLPSDASLGDRGAYGVILAEGREELDATLADMAIGLLCISVALSAAAIGLVVSAVRRGLQPLDVFSDSVAALDVHSLAYRFPADDLPDELRPISTRLNDMLGRLNAAFARERRFSENVAHELRTPLAELQSMIEVAMKWPLEPHAIAAHHNASLDVVRRMSSVVQNLLTLIRSGVIDADRNAAPVDLTAAARTAWLPHEVMAERRDVRLIVTAEGPASVRANPDVLASLLDNLFSNAATYALPHTIVACAVAARRDDGAIRFRLTNAAESLDDEDLTHFEEPFWRKDVARSSGEHAGLGLALVREYANALGIGYRTFRPDAQHVTAELTWPARSQVPPSSTPPCPHPPDAGPVG